MRFHTLMRPLSLCSPGFFWKGDAAMTREQSPPGPPRRGGVREGGGWRAAPACRRPGKGYVGALGSEGGASECEKQWGWLGRASSPSPLSLGSPPRRTDWRTRAPPALPGRTLAGLRRLAPARPTAPRPAPSRRFFV